MSLFRLILGTVCLALLSTLGFALAAAPDCTTQPCVYVPFALKPPSNAPEPTLTTTIQPTTTASPTTPAEPTTTASPTHTPAGPTVTATQTRTPSPTATATQTSTPSSTPTRTQTPNPTATPTLPPPSFVSCGTQPDSGTAPDWPVQITNINKVTEAVTLFNRSTIVVNLAGWKMCSITGGQQHPISGSLAAGETKTFVNTGGPIWNNTSPDPGALYNPNGQLVSYRAQ